MANVTSLFRQPYETSVSVHNVLNLPEDGSSKREKTQRPPSDRAPSCEHELERGQPRRRKSRAGITHKQCKAEFGEVCHSLKTMACKIVKNLMVG